MRRSKNTKTHNIYLLNKVKVERKFFDGIPTAVNGIINKLMDEAAVYKEQELKDCANTKEFSVRLFFHGDENHGSKLASFCRPFVKENQEIVTFCPKSASSVMFIWSTTHIYIITTGQGFRVVEDFCVPKFGMLVVSTFKKLFRITALDSNGMSSIIHSSKTIYANEIDFIDVDALDTVFKEVTGRLNDQETVHQLLGLTPTSKKKSVKVAAKNYVQFCSSLNFDGLIRLLGLIDQYDFDALQDNFNLVSPINPKQSPAIINENNQKVIEMLYTAIIMDSPISFDLFHHSTNDFISADSYSIYLEGVGDLSTTEDIDPTTFIKSAYQVYIKENEQSLESFSEFVSNVKLNATKGDIVVTSDPLLKHISGEIQVHDKNYYIFYGDYYYLSASYSTRLNQSLKGKLQSERYTQEIHTLWRDADKEDDFNARVSNDEDYIHLHKVKPEYIEFADLLKYKGTTVTIVHVKDGFDDDMRALDRQVELSITRIMDLKNNNNSDYMRSLYQNAAKNNVGKNIKVVFPNEDTFINCIKRSDIRYIIAIHPPIKDLMANRSNIAKHCLNALILRCFNQGIELRIDVL